MAEIHEFVADVLERYYRIHGASALSRQEVYDIAGRERQHDVFLRTVKEVAFDKHRLIVMLDNHEIIGLLKARDIPDLPRVTNATQIGILQEVQRYGMKPFLRRAVRLGAPPRHR